MFSDLAFAVLVCIAVKLGWAFGAITLLLSVVPLELGWAFGADTLLALIVGGSQAQCALLLLDVLALVSGVIGLRLYLVVMKLLCFWPVWAIAGLSVSVICCRCSHRGEVCVVMLTGSQAVGSCFGRGMQSWFFWMFLTRACSVF